MFQDPEKCITTPDCPDGYWYSQQLGNCTCDPDENPNCIPGCPEGYWYSQQLSTCTCDPDENPNCVPACPEGYYYSHQLGKCTCDPNENPDCCPEGFFWNDMTQSCFENCTEGYYFNAVFQNCTIEPEDCKDGPGHWQDAAGRCRCTEDYYMGGDETCYPCPPNMHNEDREGYCECAQGYYFDPDRPDVCIIDLGDQLNFHQSTYRLETLHREFVETP